MLDSDYSSEAEAPVAKKAKLSTGKMTTPKQATKGTRSGAFQTKLLINGKWVDAVKGNTFPVIDPSTGEEIVRVAEAQEEDVNLAVKAARKAFESWRKEDPSKRRDLLLRLADLIEDNQEELATLETLDNGKPLAESMNVDLVLVIKCFRYYAGFADKIYGKTCPVDGNFVSFTKHEPKGVCAAVIPWNFPLLMATWKLAPALSPAGTLWC
eukprot:Sspe_Gene.58::Locus_21_Transcript_2_2_Confidence_0.500_Length_1679::g.58::m.58/K00128/ALDH; aldehyde dehydrogenase (NAD+)